jgi:hypothetical protein
MTKQFELLNVTFLPRLLDPGILYVSKKYGISGHLCPCGCGNKIITPLDKTEWYLKVKKNKPSLYPSIGNWQLPCKSHYWIINGNVIWSQQWTEKQIKYGWETENSSRELYYKNHEKSNFFKRIKK